MDFKGKVAVVTGSSRGIGKAIALELAKGGAKVIINSTKQESVNEVVAEFKKMKLDAVGVAGDVSKKADVQKMVDTAVKKFGKLDIMVNNAGVFTTSPITDLSEDDWQKVIDIDLKGTYLGCQSAAKQMIKQGKGGKILNIASIAGVVGFTGSCHYCSAKGGVIQMTKEVALELGPKKINVNAIGPGVIDTEMTKGIQDNPAQLKAMMARIPKGRLGKPEDIAKAAAFLVSDDADYITGITLFVDGGWLTQ